MSPEKILSKLAITDVISVSCDSTVEDALRLLDEKKLRAVPVIDENNIFKGLFSTHEVIKSLVPSYMMDDLQSLDFAVGVSGILASRIRKLFPSRVGDHVSREDTIKIAHDTHTWEALRMLSKYGSPLPIVEETTGKLKGLISEQSAIQALLQMEADDDAELETELNTALDSVITK